MQVLILLKFRDQSTTRVMPLLTFIATKLSEEAHTDKAGGKLRGSMRKLPFSRQNVKSASLSLICELEFYKRFTAK